MRILGVIPARYGSTRFPGKPLAMIGAKPMIQRVYEQASQCKSLSAVIVATDDQRIYDAVVGFGGEVVMTSSVHKTGTDRCFEAVQKWDNTCDVVINIQGDEPFIDPRQIGELANCFEHENTQIATLIKKADGEALFDPNKPKVVVGKDGHALYFSREPIPHLRGVERAAWSDQHNYYKHIGIYGYRLTALEAITKLEMGVLEQAESLEQLRWLENGFRIRVAVTKHEAFSIDTPEDLEKILTEIQDN
jgi:3-deoxy-manno-octulosonate cytidylyltransferase (CMP-KDO synthetase)